MATMKNIPPAANVDAYLAVFDESTRKKLEQIRQAIRTAAPEAEESISYQMPSYKCQGVLVYFAGHMNHIGFYPGPSTIEAFRDQLAGFHTSKGTLQFPLDKAIPTALVRKMVKFKLNENRMKAEARKKKRK